MNIFDHARNNPLPQFTPREISIYLRGMADARDKAQTTGKGNTAARAIQTEITTLQMYAERQKVI